MNDCDKRTDLFPELEPFHGRDKIHFMLLEKAVESVVKKEMEYAENSTHQGII